MLLPDVRNGDWHHIVMVFDPATRSRYFYANGTLFAKTGNAPYLPAMPEGQFHLGVGLELCDTGGCAVEEWNVAGSIDELRIYNRTLSAEEIQTIVWTPQLSASIAASMVLHWGFDDPVGNLEMDLSGHGNHGLRGSVLGYQDKYFPVLYEDGTSSFSEISSPKYIQSTAPRINSSESFILARPAVPVEISIDHDASRDDAILPMIYQAPPYGELHLDNSSTSSGSQRLIEQGRGNNNATTAVLLSYYPPAEWPGGLAFPFNFTLRLQDTVLHTVSVYSAPPCVPLTYKIPGKIALNGYKLLSLGGVCADGQRPSVEVVRPLVLGKLYQVADGLSVRDNKRYVDFTQHQLSLFGAEITEFPAAVTHHQGIACPPFSFS